MWLPGLPWALALLVTAVSSGPSADPASIFADLSPAELRAVRTFLLERPELGLSPSQGGPLAKNSLFLVELLPPPKRRALRFLERGGARPPREARAVVFFGAQAEPNVTELAVGPLPRPGSYRLLPFKGRRAVPFSARPMTRLEYELLHGALVAALAPLEPLLLEATGFGFQNCSERCLTFSDIAPRGLGPGERRSWLVIQRFVEGFFLHPVGLEVLLDHRDPEPRRWAVQRLWYNGRYFGSVRELAESHARGSLTLVPLPEPPARQLFSSYEPRGRFSSGTPTDVHGAKVCEPQGRRYRLRGNRLEYGGWSLAFRLRSSAGLQLFDVRFGGERVAYELGVQEAIAFYGGHSPAAMQTKYMDAGWAMGASSYELARGVDCPETAAFLDAHHLLDADGPVRFRNALCVFELPTGVPLRRHFDSDFQGGFNFYAGLEGRALVLRTTSTVYNYDYIWDFLLYPNGVLEAKVHATGYIHATFYTPEGLRYGSRVHSHLLGNIHTHLVHYKVDLDVAGRDHLGIACTHRYHLAVTRRHENEPSSSSIYSQNDPWDPPVTFESFIRDNETIEDQDLVAWVTVGFLHVPHAEDIPNTATPGNAVGFFLRPFNFFDEDPSVASRAAVIVRPLDPPACTRLHIQRWTPGSPGPCVSPEPFTYNGTYRQL
ncbi:amiloride-sensitive amine oxidase [copper-containing]-like protein [Turdus rufiventris]|nr:amiloride-sensitive amine oxidase [copper-containing]-like protein [Turdus rufiventris]